MNHLVQDLWQLFYPPLCTLCRNRLIAGEDTFCLRCLYSLPEFDQYVSSEHPAYLQLKGLTPYRNVVAAFRYSSGSILKSAFKALKYGDRPDVGRVLGKLLGSHLKGYEHYRNCDVVIPVPLHCKKFRKRGYNQAEIIASSVGKELGIPLRTDLVERKYSGTTQTKKNRWQRQEGFADGYHLSAKTLPYRSALIVDDIITTGATITACGEAFNNISGMELFAASVAFTQK